MRACEATCLSRTKFDLKLFAKLQYGPCVCVAVVHGRFMLAHYLLFSNSDYGSVSRVHFVI